MKKSFLKLLILAWYFLVIASAVPFLCCCFRPIVQHGHDSSMDASNDTPIDASKGCLLKSACNQWQLRKDKELRTDFIGWNWNEMEREWKSYRGQCAFTEFNKEIGDQMKWRYDPLSVQAFIKQASIEESRNLNQVIVYHGEKMGIWLLQVLAKQLRYPHAKEWLPLRFDPDVTDIDADTLQSMIRSGLDDHSLEFTAVGLAAHVNLMSTNPAESAAYVFWYCNGFSGMSSRPLDSVLTSLGIPPNLHAPVQERLSAIQWAIQWKMKWYGGENQIVNYQSWFPSLNGNDIEMIHSWRESYLKNTKSDGIGVILQIAMPWELATKYSYASGPFGDLKNEPFLKYYNGYKNKLDIDGQLRIAMGHPFTRYPSPVKIKALSPIFQDSELMYVLAKMMKDTVDFIRS